MIHDIDNIKIDGTWCGCVETTNALLFFIEDVKGASTRIVDENNSEENLLCVKNADNREVLHVSIDNCLFKQPSELIGERCDCMIINRNHVSYVEIGLNTKDKLSNVTIKAKKARAQLGKTIKYFNENGFSEKGKRIDAVFCGRKKLPRSNTIILEIRETFQCKYSTKAKYIEDNNLVVK